MPVCHFCKANKAATSQRELLMHEYMRCADGTDEPTGNARWQLEDVCDECMPRFEIVRAASIDYQIYLATIRFQGKGAREPFVDTDDGHSLSH